ncbi:MAG TPA: hypothetical protein VIS72_10150 [Anaerolineales bacterium]
MFHFKAINGILQLRQNGWMRITFPAPFRPGIRCVRVRYGVVQEGRAGCGRSWVGLLSLCLPQEVLDIGDVGEIGFAEGGLRDGQRPGFSDQFPAEICDISADVSLEHNVLLDARVIGEARWRYMSEIRAGLYQNISREAIPLAV